MHAHASRDPIFLAMNRRGQEETAGELGSFCVNCHAPLAVREGATTDGLDLESVPEALQGVTCYACHNVEAIEANHNNGLRLSGDETLRGRLKDPQNNGFHASEYSPLLAGDSAESSALCGSCHDVVLPSGVALERTFAQWQGSVFAPEHAPVPSAVSTCAGCHMRGKSEPVAAGGPTRTRHSHHMAGVDTPLSADSADSAALADAQRAELQRQLDTTLRIELCVQFTSDQRSAVEVIIDNASAGHAFPSGAAHDRRAWVELIAYSDGAPLYQSGVVPADLPVTELDDPDLWLFRDEVRDLDGKPTHMFWDIASLTEQTIAAQVTSDPSDPDYYLSHAVRRFPRKSSEFIDGTPDRVTVRVRLQPIGLEVLDDLITSGHLDPRFRDAMPTFDLLPNRQLAAPELSELTRVSMEWSAATLSSPVFASRQDASVNPPKSCVGMPVRGR